MWPIMNQHLDRYDQWRVGLMVPDLKLQVFRKPAANMVKSIQLRIPHRIWALAGELYTV
jgi:hypothetical protein